MNKIVPRSLFGNSIALSTSETTAAIDLALYANTFKFSAQLDMAGDGTMTLEYLCSNDNINFVAPAGNDIVTGWLKTDGPGGDGQTAPIEFEPPMCKYLKLKATETGGANTITPTVVLAIQ